VRSRTCPRGHHQPADRRAARAHQQQVRPGDLRRQARASDQRLLQPALRGPAGVRRPAGGHRSPGEAPLDRAPRDQRGPADPHRRREL
ncbi:MAG: DNA-directed RNA polymerase omega subunit, partial [uncultured Nocardioidaceae bacterium]